MEMGFTIFNNNIWVDNAPEIWSFWEPTNHSLRWGHSDVTKKTAQSSKPSTFGGKLSGNKPYYSQIAPFPVISWFMYIIYIYIYLFMYVFIYLCIYKFYKPINRFNHR